MGCGFDQVNWATAPFTVTSRLKSTGHEWWADSGRATEINTRTTSAETHGTFIGFPPSRNSNANEEARSGVTPKRAEVFFPKERLVSQLRHNFTRFVHFAIR